MQSSCYLQLYFSKQDFASSLFAHRSPMPLNSISTNRTVDMSLTTLNQERAGHSKPIKNLELQHHVWFKFLTCIKVHGEFPVDIPGRDGVDEFTPRGATRLDGSNRSVQGKVLRHSHPVVGLVKDRRRLVHHFHRQLNTS